MSDDFETIEYLDVDKDDEKKKSKKKPKKEKKTMISNLVDALANTNLKLLLFIFVLFIFVNTDLFVDKLLSRIDGAVDHRAATSKGVVIQGVFIVLMFVMADTLIQAGII